MEKRGMFDLGSMLNTSEGVFTTGALGALVALTTNSSDWRVVASAAFSIAIIASTYVVMRTKAKLK